MLLLDGKKTAADIRAEIGAEVAALREKGLRAPALAVILAGDDPASKVYVRNKQKACEDAGITSVPFILPASTGQDDLLGLIRELNHRDDVDGILLQLPLPKGLNATACLEAIDPDKDVDGFHPINMGRLALGLPGFVPCTPAGIMELLRRHGLSLSGKKAVVVGRSDIVGKPLALLLLRKDANATVSICHSGTRDLAEQCRQADFLFVAMGKPRAIKEEMISPGCVVVDVGINRTPEGLCGDVDFERLAEKTAAITPVPGGIGPMTIAMLLANTLEAFKKSHRKSDSSK